MNISLQRDVESQDLLSEHLHGRPLPFDEDLEALLVEVSCPNEDAYREILQLQPLPGHPKPRLAYARNFFGSLEDIARYWDTSKDEYYRVSIDNPARQTPEQDDNDVEMRDVNGADAKSTKEVYKGYRYGNGPQTLPGTRVALVKNLLKMVTHKFQCRDHEPMPAPREKLTIRGVRIACIQYHFCIARIPDGNKSARSRVVEGPIMAAHIREELRFRQENGRFHTAKAVPNQEQIRRTGSAFVDGSPFTGERFDLFREIGCMLILASQRNREGKSKELLGGTDKWWVKQPRFGGGPSRWGQLPYEVYDEDDPSWSPAERILQEEKRARGAKSKLNDQNSVAAMSPVKITTDDLLARNAPDLKAVPGGPLVGPRKKKLRSLEKPADKADEMRDGRRLMYTPPIKKRLHQDWQNLKANTPVWDDKIIYKRIGKADESEFDEVFMVSSANHHVALLKMKVHPDYLEWLESGRSVSGEEIEDGLRRNVLYVQRSKWYDLFDVGARRELVVALWTVMCWMNRKHIGEAELSRTEEKRRALKQL